jgi:hypothetical protein
LPFLEASKSEFKKEENFLINPQEEQEEELIEYDATR